jgi:hypothetical protein
MKLEDISVGMEVIVINKTHSDGNSYAMWLAKSSSSRPTQIVTNVILQSRNIKYPPAIEIDGNYFRPEDLEPVCENSTWFEKWRRE